MDLKIVQTERAYIPLRLTRFGLADLDLPKRLDRPEYGVTFISSGYVRRRDGRASNWIIPTEALMPVVPLFSGAANFIDHASLATWFYPQIKDMAGVTFGAHWNSERMSIDGGLRLSARPDLAWYRSLLDEYLEDMEAGRDVPDVGLSAVLYQESIEEMATDGSGEQIRKTTLISHVESVDTVFGPGAEGRLREALQTLNQFISLPSGLNTRGVKMNEQEQTVQPVAEVAPPVEVVSPVGLDLSPLTQQLNSLQSEVARLSAALAAREEPEVIQGMGRAPRDAKRGFLTGGETSLERFRSNVEWLFGVPGAPYPDPQFRRADMIYQALTGDWDWRGVFDPDRVMLAGVNSTDMPNLAVNAMNKVVTLLYASLRAYRWYEMVTAVTPNDGSVQPLTLVGTGGVGALPTVAEKGAYTELSMADSKETASFVKKGGYVGITLEMFRNSEIGKIQAVPQGLARGSVQARSAAVAAIFTANAGVGPTLATDSKALFHNDHSNLATTAFGTDSTAWNAVDLAIWGQTELGSSVPLAISPKYWLGHRTGFRAALVVFGYGDGQPTTYIPEAMDRGPDDPRPWPIAVPDFTDTTDWAAIVDPKIYPVIHMSYAQQGDGQNHPAPELYAVTDATLGLVFTNDTFPVKVRDWFAVGVNGYRGIAKRNVA